MKLSKDIPNRMRTFCPTKAKNVRRIKPVSIANDMFFFVEVYPCPVLDLQK